ncbi:MAG TPA: hypothetical protein VGE50_11680 [Gammaproteobacteria bacterium]
MAPTNRTLTLIIWSEALLFLLPSTVLFIAGFIFSILAAFSANKGTFTPAFLAITAFLLLPGYGLYSLWWLVVKINKVAAHQVPRFIWIGVAVGGLLALLFALPFLISWLAPAKPMISAINNTTTLFLFGGGPLVVALTLLALVRPWRSSNG